MDPWSRFKPEEQKLALAVADDFGSSLELETMFSNARERLGQLIPVEALALCVSRPGDAPGYDWVPFGLSSSFFHHYLEVAPYDFVRGSTTRFPNQALRDSEMVPRDELIRNPMYERLRELGQPIEHCMSVSLWVSPEWHGGVTFYRARRRPFSQHHQALLQWLTPRLARAIGHCRTFGETRTQAALLRAVAERQGAVILVRGTGLDDWTPTASATALLEEWFPPSERVAGIPQEFRTRLASLAKRGGGPDDGPLVWIKRDTDKDLKVTFEPLPTLGGAARSWLIQLEERRLAIPFPRSWRGKLSPKETEVVSLAFLFWDYQSIAEELEIKLNTVKQHIESACNKLGAYNLKRLMALALRDS